MIKQLGNRLAAIGIDIALTANYPWVYLTTVNGNHVSEKFMARHGFTAFILQPDGSFKLTNRRKVFEILRKYRDG